MININYIYYILITFSVVLGIFILYSLDIWHSKKIIFNKKYVNFDSKIISFILSSILAGSLSFIITWGLQKCNSIEDRTRIEDLKKNLRSSKDLYNSYQIPTSELVSGKKGSYYLIDLKNTEKQTILKFENGKYIINNLNKDFGVSIVNFLNDFDYLIKHTQNAKIYILGSADILGNNTFHGVFEPSKVYSTIYFHKQISPELFSPEISEINISNHFKNSELPILRSAFLQDILKNPYGYESEIIEGTVSLNINSEERNVKIILYTDWNEKN